MEKEKNEIMQYLTFILDKEIFAFNVLNIKEVLELPRVTKMPKTPEFMSGIINLRGGVVPVIDLRTFFNINAKDFTVDTSIIIVEVNYEGEEILIGALVDAVKAVIKINSNDLEPPPKVGMKLNVDLIESIGKYNEEFIMILNSNKIFSETELNMIQESITGNKTVNNKEETESVNT